MSLVIEILLGHPVDRPKTMRMYSPRAMKNASKRHDLLALMINLNKTFNLELKMATLRNGLVWQRFNLEPLYITLQRYFLHELHISFRERIADYNKGKIHKTFNNDIIKLFPAYKQLTKKLTNEFH